MDLGNDITIEEDLDKIPITASFTLPFIKEGELDTTNIRKYDSVKIYFAWFTSAAGREVANIANMNLIFDGYINTLSNSENKDGGDNYNINCVSTAGLMYERSMEIKSFTGHIPVMMDEALKTANMIDYFKEVKYSEDISKNFVAKIDSSNFLGKVLDSIKEKYAIQIYQTPDTTLNIVMPSWFSDEPQQAYVYDMTQNIFNMNYGEISNNVDTIIVMGNNCVGFAFDPISYQLKSGVAPEDVKTDITPQRDLMSDLVIWRRDLLNKEDCQTVAKEKLVELARNYSINFDTEFEPTQTIGQTLLINNSKKISSGQKWIIKKRSIKISKDDVNCNIVCYSNSIVDMPNDMLLPSSLGLLDTDVLEITDKLEEMLDPR